MASGDATQAVNVGRVVFKYPLDMDLGPQRVNMPHGARIVHVHEQNGRPCLWAEVNTSAPLTERTFYVVATGETLAVRATRHIGTVHVEWAVWHIYEEG